jgi:AhpD family alkylhydroperoxidase
MARIPSPPDAQLDDRQRSIFDAVKSHYGGMLEPVAAMAWNDAVLDAYLAYEGRFAQASALPERVRQLVDVKAAALLSCEFCIDIGSHLSLAGGVTADELLDLPRFETSPRFDAAEKAALRFCVAMTRGDASVDDALFDALRPHFSEAQIVELAAVIAWENFRARFNKALGFAAHGFTEGGACALPEPPTTG